MVDRHKKLSVNRSSVKLELVEAQSRYSAPGNGSRGESRNPDGIISGRHLSPVPASRSPAAGGAPRRFPLRTDVRRVSGIFMRLQRRPSSQLHPHEEMLEVTEAPHVQRC
ncbi:hypothetical protein JOB18_027400 [Solea senegalensis]|uniref:Uncharacterized protein n=1 Tax=Solea senegalensis TaxID=28829 RepID=A0AAV6Q9H3_SOLSE|nr:hypothetical protein JOB18_027400 [Solea senegalensis]